MRGDDGYDHRRPCTGTTGKEEQLARLASVKISHEACISLETMTGMGATGRGRQEHSSSLVLSCQRINNRRRAQTQTQKTKDGKEGRALYHHLIVLCRARCTGTARVAWYRKEGRGRQRRLACSLQSPQPIPPGWGKGKIGNASLQ